MIEGITVKGRYGPVVTSVEPYGPNEVCIRIDYDDNPELWTELYISGHGIGKPKSTPEKGGD